MGHRTISAVSYPELFLRRLKVCMEAMTMSPNFQQTVMTKEQGLPETRIKFRGNRIEIISLAGKNRLPS